jgi:hypothetical protein
MLMYNIMHENKNALKPVTNAQIINRALLVIEI